MTTVHHAQSPCRFNVGQDFERVSVIERAELEGHYDDDDDGHFPGLRSTTSLLP